MRPFKKEYGKDGSDERNPRNTDFRLKFRRLQFVNDDDLIWTAYNGTSHKIRHKKKLRKFNERFSDKHFLNESDSMYKNEILKQRAQNVSKNLTDYGITGNHSVILKNMDNKVNYSEDIVREKIDIHDHCYTTNEVLEIIAVTCLVNFIFWFLIISCVNFLTKKEKVKYPSWESMESVEISPEYEMKLQNERSQYSRSLRRSVTGSDLVDEGFGSNFLTLGDAALTKRNDGRCSHVGDNLFEDDDLDWAMFHDEGLELNNWKNRRKSFLPSSYSMENLIF